MKSASIMFGLMWLAAQVLAVVALINNNAPLLYGSIAMAWVGGIGMVACILLRKGQSLLGSSPSWPSGPPQSHWRSRTFSFHLPWV